MDEPARQLLDACAPHVPCALLAHLWRLGEPFPVHAEPRAEGGFQHVLDAGGWTGGLISGGAYVVFRCPDCLSIMFQPNTARGIAHALKVAQNHKPDCCAERAQAGVITAWPDRLDE